MAPNLPSFRSYGDYSSDNYGAHCLVFSIGPNAFYFSYKTLVAFETPSTGLVCRENAWGPTTGRHLNWIEPNHKDRVNAETFQSRYKEAFGGTK